MGDGTGLRVDMDDFGKRIEEILTQTIPSVAAEALYEEGLKLLDDAENKSPQVPYKEGDLRASRFVERPVIKDTDILVSAGYNMPYAAYQEAGQRKDGTRVIKNWTRDRIADPGAHFLTAKLVGMAKERFQRIADYIKNHAK